MWSYLDFQLQAKIILEDKEFIVQMAILDPYPYLLVATDNNNVYYFHFQSSPVKITLFKKQIIDNILDNSLITSLDFFFFDFHNQKNKYAQNTLLKLIDSVNL